MTAHRIRVWVATSFLFVASASEAVQLGRAAIAAPAVMASNCAGLTNGASPAPGDLVVTGFPAELVCNSEQTAFPTAASGASYSNAAQSVSAASQSFVGWGAVRLSTDFSGPNSAIFPQAVATAGWVDGLTVTPVSPAMIGQSAIMNFRIHLQGDLLALAGFNSVARLAVRPYVNDQALAVPTDVAIQGQGLPNSPYQTTVDLSASFGLPIVLGTPFELGVFARASSGTASIAGSSLINTVSSDAASVDWEGITSITVAGQPVDVVVDSVSGIDWTGPVPEPAMGLGLLAGSGCLMELGSRRRRQVGVSRRTASSASKPASSRAAIAR